MSTATTKKPAATGAKSASRTRKASSKTSAKPTAAAKAPVTAVTGKAPAPTPPAAPTVVTAPEAVVLGAELRKKELIEDVVSRTGLKKKDVKPAVEATLAALGDALLANRELVLPPMGKLKVRREKDMPNARVLVAKIRQPKAG